MTSELVIPSEIPWADLTGKDLEECIYWLMDGLGGKDLEWRLGGTGAGAADGGRDLEVHFLIPGPDGEINRQKWWIEAKGRSSTVEIAAVRDAVLNAAGRADLDVVIIASNSVFSNPTRDWIATWQASHARPVVRLWDRHHLERLLCEHPEVVIRLFARALSPQGKLEVVRSRFWNYTSYAGVPTLEELWDKREELEWSDMAVIATIVSECANGDITERPWAAMVEDDYKLLLFAVALANILYFCFRANDAGVAQEPYIEGAAYLLLVCLQAHDAAKVLKIVHGTWRELSHDEKAHEIMRRHAFAPILNILLAQLRDLCANDCRRVTRDPTVLSKRGIQTYWDRLRPRDDAAANPQDRRQIIIEDGREECNIGLPLTTEVFCPLVHTDVDEEKVDFEAALDLLRAVIKVRVPKFESPAGTA